jgi:hypothetical protein
MEAWQGRKDPLEAGQGLQWKWLAWDQWPHTSRTVVKHVGQMCWVLVMALLLSCVTLNKSYNLLEPHWFIRKMGTVTYAPLGLFWDLNELIFITHFAQCLAHWMWLFLLLWPEHLPGGEIVHQCHMLEMTVDPKKPHSVPKCENLFTQL